LKMKAAIYQTYMRGVLLEQSVLPQNKKQRGGKENKMKITKTQLKQIIKEEISNVLSEGEYDIGAVAPAMSPEGLKDEELNDILSRLADPEQKRQVKDALIKSGVFDLDPIEHKEKIKLIMNTLRGRMNADEVLDFILVQIADKVLKVNI